MRGYGNPGTQFGTPVDPNGRAIGLEAFYPEQTALADVNFDGRRIRDLSGLNIGYKNTREVWFGERITGNQHPVTPPTGSGSKDDPYDISTKARFDAQVAALLGLAQTKVLLGIRDGEFELTGPGAAAANILRGWEIYGAGAGKTIIKLMAAGFIFSVGQSTDRGENVIEGISFDCGYSRIGTPGNWSPFVLGGPNCKVRNCEVYDAGNDATECFVIWIGSGGDFGDPPDNALVEGCYVHDCGENASMIAVTNLGGTAVAFDRYAMGGVVRNNIVKGDYGNFASQGVGLAGFDGGIIEGNIIENTTHGVYDDTMLNKNLIIRSNQIHGVDNGILYHVPTQAQENIQVYGNVIKSNSAIGFQSESGLISKLFIHGNRCIDLAGGTGNFSIFLEGVDGAVVIDNIIDATLTHTETDSSNVYYRGNLDPENPTGAPIIPDTVRDTVGPVTFLSPNNTPGTAIAKFRHNDNSAGVALIADGITVSGTPSTIPIKVTPKGMDNVFLGYNDLVKIDNAGFLYIGGNRVLKTSITGWTPATGTATRTAFATSTVTLEELAQRVKALIDDLHANAGHGLLKS